MGKHVFYECRTKYWLFWALVFVAIQSFAQESFIVKGKIVDDHGESIIGANVMEKGTTNGVISDISGNFSIKVASNATLVVSYIGYSQQEVAVKGNKNLTIHLSEDTQNLNEVVVIGYGSARKKDLTGSIMQVKASQLANESPSSMQDLLRANVPGLSVGFSAGTKPGGSLLIRGKNSINGGTSPLIVLDGVIYSGDITDINTNDIEQIDVLKDASSAAIYGARSASGVIIITTKQGKTEKPIINFDVQLGIATHATMEDVYDTSNFTNWRTDVFNSSKPNHQPYEFNDPRTLPSDVSLEDWMAYEWEKSPPWTKFSLFSLYTAWVIWFSRTVCARITMLAFLEKRKV